MKKILISMLVLGGFCTNLLAQNPWVNDSVSMGTGSGSDVYYSMTTGTVKSENNKNWHLAFSMKAGDSSAIWANHNAGNAFVQVYNIHKDKSQWATVGLADTSGGTPCFNMDKSWSQGALNDIPSGDPFNFGWGTYNQVTHNLYGDSIFIVKANNVYYKVLIDSLQATLMTYHFRVGDLAANTTATYTLAKGTKYANAIFAHFDLASGMDTLREPDIASWDILFNRYNSLVAQGGPAQPYSVVGALGNRGITFGKAAMVHVDTANNNYPTYTTPWVTSISGIGYEWKTFTPPAGPWVVPDSLSYFVKDLSGKIYQLQFTGYSGTGTGNINFRKRMVTPTAVKDVNSVVSQYQLFPNPAQNSLSVLMDAKESTEGSIQIVDISGKMVSSLSVKLHGGINAFIIPTNSLANGSYILYISGKNMLVKEKIVISK
jgi:hypothetical protein